MAAEIIPSTSVGNRAIEIARSKLGQHEEGGPNQGPIVTWSITPWPHDDPRLGIKWCAGFACTCLLLAGAKMKAVGSLSCEKLLENCQLRAWAWRFDASQNGPLPSPGDLVFFAKDEQIFHVGLVESVDDENGIITTLEGNAEDAVRRHTYPISDPHIYGFASIPG